MPSNIAKAYGLFAVNSAPSAKKECRRRHHCIFTASSLFKTLSQVASPTDTVFNLINYLVHLLHFLIYLILSSFVCFFAFDPSCRSLLGPLHLDTCASLLPPLSTPKEPRSGVQRPCHGPPLELGERLEALQSHWTKTTEKSWLLSSAGGPRAQCPDPNPLELPPHHPFETCLTSAVPLQDVAQPPVLLLACPVPTPPDIVPSNLTHRILQPTPLVTAANQVHQSLQRPPLSCLRILPQRTIYLPISHKLRRQKIRAGLNKVPTVIHLPQLRTRQARVYHTLPRQGIPAKARALPWPLLCLETFRISI